MHSLKHYYSRCPSCSADDTLRISRPRKFGERIIKKITWLDLYRCKKCGWRGYKSSFRFSAGLVKGVVLHLLLIALAALIIYQILIRIS